MPTEDKLQHIARANHEDILAEIDAITARSDEVPAAGTLEPAPSPSPASAPNAYRAALIAANAAELKADAYANGWTMQGWRTIDAHRKANPENHARNRRGEYVKKVFDETGRVPRRNRKNPTPDQRKADNAKAQQEQRNMLTPGSPERLAYNAAGAARAKASRVRKKELKELQAEAEQIALQNVRTFSVD